MPSIAKMKISIASSSVNTETSTILYHMCFRIDLNYLQTRARRIARSSLKTFSDFMKR